MELITFRVIIVGGGQLGSNLAKRLQIFNHDPVIIEKNENRIREISGDLEIPVIQGDGTKEKVLEKAKINQSNALAAVTRSDEVNLMAGKLAKKEGCEKVVARANKDKNRGMFENENIDIVISYKSSVITLYEKAITGSEIYGILTLGGEKADVIEVKVSEKSDVSEKKIKEIPFPEKCSVAIITRKGKLLPPRGDTKLKPEDRVILAGKRNELISTYHLFNNQGK